MEEKLKKHIIGALAVTFTVAVIASGTFCNGKEKEPEVPMLSVTPPDRDIVLAADGVGATSYGESIIPTFTVATNQKSWDVKPSHTWVKATRSGNQFTLSADPLTDSSTPEPAEVIITAGKTSIKIRVKQSVPASVPVLSVDPPDSEIDVQQSIPVQIPVSGIFASQSSLNLFEGNRELLTASLMPENHTEQGPGTVLRWATSDPAVATVSGGAVTAVGKGSAVITVSLQRDPSIKTEIPVVVLGIFSEWNQELPVLRIAQLCDPQFGFGIDGYENDVLRLEKSVQKINELMPDIVVVAGDFVHESNNDEAFATFQKIIAQLKAPVLLTPGNHDIPNPVTVSGLQRYRSRFGEDFGVVECKGRCIISANSQMWMGAPAEEIIRHDNLLLNALQKAKKEKQPVVMLTHIPPFVSFWYEADEYFNVPKAKREDMLALCAENGVVLWLAGHTHTTSQRSYRQITILNGETTSQNFDGHQLGFRLLTICSDHFEWDFFSCELNK